MSMNDNDVVLVVVKMLIIISIMSLSISSKTSASSFLSQFRHSSSGCCKYILCRLNFILLLSAPCSLTRQNKLTFVFSLNLMIILIKMIIAHGQIESTERFKLLIRNFDHTDLIGFSHQTSITFERKFSSKFSIDKQFYGFLPK